MGGYYDNWSYRPQETTADKVIKVAKKAAPIVAGGATLAGLAYGAVTYGGPVVDAAGDLIGKAGEAIGLVQGSAPRSEDWKDEVAKANATPLPHTLTPSPSATATPLSELTNTIPSAEPSPIPEFIESAKQWVSSVSTAGYTYYLDNEGIPVQYVGPDNITHTLSTSEKEEMEKAQQLAKTSHFPQIAKTIDITPLQKELSESAEHPIFETLPDDVMTDAELKEKNIKIIQEKPTFFIRKTALNKGMPLEDCNNGKVPMEIFVIDTPFLSDVLVPKDPTYDHARDALLNKGSMFQKEPTVLNTELFKKTQYNRLKKELAEIEKKIAAGAISPYDEYTYFKIKGELDLLDDFTDQQWRWYELSSMATISDRKVGGFTTIHDEDTNQRINVILLATGQEEISPQRLLVGFDSAGEIIFTGVNPYSLYGTPPEADASYPDPSRFKVNPNATKRDYQITEGNTAGGVVAHEAGHYYHMWHRMNTVDPKDPKYKKADGTYDFDMWMDDTFPNRSEYDADQYMLDYMEAAWRHYNATGENTKWGFVFKLDDGRYIITENQKKPEKSPLLVENMFPGQDLAHMNKVVNPIPSTELANPYSANRHEYVDKSVVVYKVDSNGKLVEVSNPKISHGEVMKDLRNQQKKASQKGWNNT